MFSSRTGLVAGVLISIFGLACDVMAQELKPGEYIREFGLGELAITRKGTRAPTFTLYAHGKNTVPCRLDGAIREGVAVLFSEFGSSEPCKVRFKIIPTGIRVSVEDTETCYQVCGVLEGFNGDYLKPALGCTPTAIRATRTAFKRAYDVKAYAKARFLLEPVLTKCASTLGVMEWGWIVNDVAIAQYRSGDSKACRETLQGLVPDLKDTKEDVRTQRPSDAESWWPIVSAARTNMKLCTASR